MTFSQKSRQSQKMATTATKIETDTIAPKGSFFVVTISGTLEGGNHSFQDWDAVRPIALTTSFNDALEILLNWFDETYTAFAKPIRWEPGTIEHDKLVGFPDELEMWAPGVFPKKWTTTIEESKIRIRYLFTEIKLDYVHFEAFDFSIRLCKII